jgi:methylated-DNA-[protein]-cysteine S-methyltransferase
MDMRQRAVSFAFERLDTPTGRMLLVIDEEERLRAADWEDHEHRLWQLLRRHYRAGVELRDAPERRSAAWRALQAYFEGELGAIDEIATATNGTAFQLTVWEALRRIPVGRAVSYQALADTIGRPSATRAVGLANGSNPISIVVPCHRVIGANGSLTGYGGGLERKRWLLAHEGLELPRAGYARGVSESRPGQIGLFEPIFTKLPVSAD